jgi:hypothetical protein
MADVDVGFQDVQTQDVADVQAGEAQPDTQAQPGDGEVQDRTYTQSEVNSMRAEQDREDNSLKSAIAQYALRDQVRSAQEQENYHLQSDQKLVDEGEITTTQATERSQGRVYQRQLDMQTNQERQNVQTMGEQIGRIAASQDFGKKFGVDSDILSKDTSLITPELMEAKARQLQLDKREANMTGTETFDRGQKGGRSVSVDSMSGSEKIRYALMHPPKGQPKL